MKYQLRYLLFFIITIVLFSSCILSVPPHTGGLGFGTYTYPAPGFESKNQDVVSGGKKIGIACIIGDSIIPFVYMTWRGDSSIRAAAANGGIKKISSIAHRYSRPFFGSVQMCTVVYGE